VGVCPRYSSGVCDVAWWLNLVIHRLPRCAVVPSFIWCGTCRWIMVRLLSVIDCLYFFFLFSLLTTKVYNYPFCLLFVNFSPHSLNFLFCPYSFYINFVFSFNFVIQLQFFIYFVFHFSSHSFNF